MDTVLQVIDMYKSYPGIGRKLQVFENINLEMKRGEIVAINGPSGIGKTTLLNIIGTLDTADSGDLIISGIQPHHLNDEHLSQFRAENLGYIFQFHHLLPEFTAEENVLIPAKIVDLDKKLARVRAKTLLEAVGLYSRRHHKPSQLSGGERQRVAVARALMNRPELVLADEPTGNLDPDNGKRLIDLIHSVRESFEQSFLIATHSRSLSAACDRVITLS